MERIFALLAVIVFAVMCFAAKDTIPDGVDVINAKGGVERPAFEYSGKIKKHWLDKGSKIFCILYAVHNNGTLDTIINDKCLTKKTVKSDTLNTTVVRNIVIVEGDVPDSSNGHR